MTTREYDVITLQTIRTAPGTLAYTSLTSDGLGGTYWSTLSTPMSVKGETGFSRISTSPGVYVADASYNIMSFYSGKGIDFTPVGKYSTSIISHAFNEFMVPGLSSMKDMSTLTLSSLGNTLFTTGRNNLLTYEIRQPTFKIGTSNLSLNDLVSSIMFAGQGDILLSTFLPSYYIGIGISTFTSTGYSALFSNASTISTGTLSTLSSIYIYKSLYGQSSLQQAFLSQSTISSLLYYKTIDVNQYYTSTLSLYSTFFTSTIQNISSQMGNISTTLYNQMIVNTSTTITSTFGAAFYLYKNSTFRNVIYDIKNASTVISNRLNSITNNAGIVNIYNTSTITLQVQSTTMGIYGKIASTVADFDKFSSVIYTTFATPFSSFSTSMTTTFSALAKTNREDYVFFPPYTVFAGVNQAIGFQFDTILSTCSVNLSGIIPYIDSNSYVYMDYIPSYGFKTLNLSTISTNAYQVSTFLVHDGITIPETIFSDMMYFNIRTLPNANQYQEVYSRPIRMRLNTDHLLLYNSDPYIITHFHSSIINVNKPYLYSVNPNVYGGIVVPSASSNDCHLNIYTMTQWSNSMQPTGAITIHINNGIRTA
jgi:hypothetical protein